MQKKFPPFVWVIALLIIVGTCVAYVWYRRPVQVDALQQSMSFEQAVAKINSCDAKKAIQEELSLTTDVATLRALGAGTFVDQGYSIHRVCRDGDYIAFLFAKKFFNIYVNDEQAGCNSKCDQDVFGAVNVKTKNKVFVVSDVQLGLYSESYDLFCYVDSIVAPTNTASFENMLLYCGNAESGGLVNWLQYDFNSDVISEIKSGNKVFQMFKYKSSQQIQP